MNELNNAQELHQFSFRKASVRRRFKAFLIDLFIFSSISVNAIAFGMLNFGDSHQTSMTLFYIFIVLVLIVSGFRDIVKGQSFGKFVLGIGVRDIHDNFAVPSVPRLFLRQVLSFLWPIEFLVLVFSKDNRKIGDKIANTGVYNLREYEDFVLGSKSKITRTAKRIIVTVLVYAIFGVVMFFGITSMLRNHPAYHIATDSIRANPEIVALIGDIESFGPMPSGSISTGPGHGDANFAIRARGAYGEVRVFVTLQRRGGGDWEIVSFDFVQLR